MASNWVSLLIVSDFTASFTHLPKIWITVLCLTYGSLASANDPKILVFGDSISAAYGMEPEQGWVQLMSDKLKQDGSHYTVINASVSGETTGGGLVRLPKTLDVHQPNILILELGGNDGLRGYPIDKIKSNLNQMIEMAAVEDIQVLLVGMVLPPNYGRRYTLAFQDSFADVATEQEIALVPHLLEGVTTPRDLMQQDGIHPRAEAQWMIVEDIYPLLKPLMNSDK